MIVFEMRVHVCFGVPVVSGWENSALYRIISTGRMEDIFGVDE